MAKVKPQNSTFQLIDLAGLFLSAWFTYTVINNVKDAQANGIQNAPASYALIIAVVIVCWTIYKNGSKLTRIGSITLTVLVTSGAIWLFGLHSYAI